MANLLIALLLLASCGTTSVVTNESATEKPKFQSLSIEVKTDVQGIEDELRLLDRALAQEFLLRRKQVVESGDIKLVATVEQFEGVSQTARFWFGSLAGAAVLRVKVVVTGANLSSPMSFAIDTRSSGASSTGDWWTGYGGSTEDLLQRAAKEIADRIL